MRRRAGCVAALALLLGAGACATGRTGARSVTLSLERLQATVAERFPQRFGAPGLLDLTLQAPRLGLRPEENRLAAQLVLDARGPLLARPVTGQADVDFGLRYEKSDHTLRATDLRLRGLSLPDVPPATAQALRQWLAQWVRESLHEVVVHRLREEDLMLAENLGLQPGAITVTPEGLRVELVPARL